MALMIKLNSREVELDKCFEKLKKIEVRKYLVPRCLH